MDEAIAAKTTENREFSFLPISLFIYDDPGSETKIRCE